MDGWMEECIDSLMYRQTNEGMRGWMDEQMDGEMNGCTCGWMESGMERGMEGMVMKKLCMEGLQGVYGWMDGWIQIRIYWTHSLDALLVDTHAAVKRFEGFAEHEGEEADGAELQVVSHFLQHLGRLLLYCLSRLSALHGHLQRTRQRQRPRPRQSCKSKHSLPRIHFAIHVTWVCTWLMTYCRDSDWRTRFFSTLALQGTRFLYTAGV